MTTPTPNIPLPQSWVLRPVEGSTTAEVVLGRSSSLISIDGPANPSQIVVTWSGQAEVAVSVAGAGMGRRHVGAIPASTTGGERRLTFTFYPRPANTTISFWFNAEIPADTNNRIVVMAYPVPIAV